MYDQCTLDQKQRVYPMIDEQKIDIAVICETWLRNRYYAYRIEYKFISNFHSTDNIYIYIYIYIYTYIS